MSVMITGVDGFIASHLVDYIVTNNPDEEIYGTIRRMADKRNISERLGDINLVEMELTDYQSVSNAVQKIVPSKIFHLAGQTFVPTSWSAPDLTMNVNANGTMNILESARKICPESFIQVAGSSEEYGLVHPYECPITEDQPLRPLSPYAVSKVAADMLGFQYSNSYGLNVLRTRTFNQTGARRGDVFVDSNFAKQIAEIEKGYRYPVVKHGNLDAIRDFTNVKDTVRAYWLLSEKKWKGEVVNICSGTGHTMEDVLDTLISMSTHKGIEKEADSARMRPSDVPRLVGSNHKLKEYIDWKPTITWKESMSELLNYWRKMA